MAVARRAWLLLLIAPACKGVIGGPATSSQGSSGVAGSGSSGSGSSSASASSSSSGGVSSGGSSSSSGSQGGSSSGQASGSSSGGIVDGGDLFAAASASSYVDAVKDLLTGLPATDAEEAAVADGGAPALQTLITGWIASGPTQAGYQEKMIAFFETAFQQNQVTPGAEFFDQHNGAPTTGILFQNFQQSFALTAWQLVQQGLPFNGTANTTSFMMTPALMAEYARIDSYSDPDQGSAVDFYTQANPNFTFTLENSQGPIPLASSLTPGNPNYLVFYSPDLPNQTTPGCDVDPRVYTAATTPPGNDVPDVLWDFEFGTLDGYVLPDGGVCPTDYHATGFIQPSDYTTWNLVNIVQPPSPILPDGGLATTLFYDLQTQRNLATAATPGNLVLNMPRVGYFTTPSFLAQWNTNQSNLARVTMNQTLIVGLNHGFDGTDSAIPPNGSCTQFSDGGWACDGGLAALGADHAAPGSACFACHETLDPMRQYFRQAYSLDFTIQTLPAEQNLPGVFAFDGVSEISKGGIFDLGNQIANHPSFATAWTEKLCTYATSAPCDETDPVFQAVATAFQASNYNWNTLVVQLFSSPLVTYATSTQTAGEQGDTISIARQAHLCALLSERLGITDVCGLSASTVVPSSLKNVQTIAAGYPSDQYGRGIVGALLNSSPSLFAFSGLENMCGSIANVVIDATGSKYQSTDPQPAIADFASNLMGLTSDRSGPVLTVLQNHFANAQSDGGVSASNALKSTFILACESVSVGGIGL
jgi:hypothetical protein